MKQTHQDDCETQSKKTLEQRTSQENRTESEIIAILDGMYENIAAGDTMTEVDCFEDAIDLIKHEVGYVEIT